MSLSTLRSPHLRIRPTTTVVVVGLLLLWQLVIGVFYRDAYTIATPAAIAVRAVEDFRFALPNILTTAGEAGWGWVLGNLTAFAVASVAVLAPITSRVLLRTSVVVYCLPVVAVGPILAIMMSQYWSVVVISAQGVFFTTLIGTLIGLQSTPSSRLDVVTAAGGTRWQAFTLARIRGAIPAVFSALKVAGPLAVLGAMIGEYLGAEKGLGVAMVYAQQSLNIDRTWALAFYATLLAGAAYGLTALAERRLYFWRGEESVADVSTADISDISTNQRWWVRLIEFVATVAVVLGFWQLLVSSINPYFAKRPADVLQFLTSGSPEQLDPVWTAFGETILHSLIGFTGGLALAFAGAVAIVLSRTVESVLMPIAMTLRTVPLVAMTPLIALLFGRGLMSVLVVSSIVTFFPALVTIVSGLRAVPPAATEIVGVSGGSAWTALRLVQVPAALPSLFGAARVAAPLAVTGALLAEWLATGNGAGFLMLRAGSVGNYIVLWTLVALVTIYAVALYGVASAGERLLQRTRN
ncbi:ABC transporter permease subunit [Streptomyces sp. SID6673]|nr:ABC transporter permease subunit [Streptomyces sp. SID11726]NEB26609.1 ABC transporter permease subunit [Streptomyces sp. SID6673]